MNWLINLCFFFFWGTEENSMPEPAGAIKGLKAGVQFLWSIRQADQLRRLHTCSIRRPRTSRIFTELKRQEKKGGQPFLVKEKRHLLDWGTWRKWGASRGLRWDNCVIKTAHHPAYRVNPLSLTWVLNITAANIVSTGTWISKSTNKTDGWGARTKIGDGLGKTGEGHGQLHYDLTPPFLLQKYETVQIRRT